jgi:tetratricopeptide (TPR) repeat protein
MKTTTSENKQPETISWSRYVVIGILATCVPVGAKLIFEHTRWGHENQLWLFGQLQGTLPAIDLDNPVVVLDITQLEGGTVNNPTPRDQLKKILTALTDLEPKPRAIAIDINFSPKGPNYSAEDDEDFFDFCLGIRNQKQVPVFLAVAETKTAPPEAWLGSEAYKDLAVAAPGDENDTSRIPLLVKSPDSPEPLKTLNYALALVYRKTLAPPHPWIGWAVDTNLELAAENFQHEASTEENAKIQYEERLVNFSKIQQMKVAAHADLDAESIKRAAANYSNKLVILGDLRTDKVWVPGYGIYPGSLALASATYTLIKEPLFEFKGWVRLLLDFVIAACVIVAIAIIRRKSPDGSLKQSLLIWAAVFLVVLAGWGLVHWAGVLWLDFLLVALALLLHPRTEHLIDRGIAKLSKSEPQAAPQSSASEAKNVVAGILILVLLASVQASAQQRWVPPGCEKTVAAVGVRLTTPKQKSRKGQQAGTCYYRENRNSEWQALTVNEERRQYRAGNHVYCDADCSLTLLFCGTATEKLVNTRKPRWFPVINAYRSAPLPDIKPNNFMRLARTFSPSDPIEGYGRYSARRVLSSRGGNTVADWGAGANLGRVRQQNSIETRADREERSRLEGRSSVRNRFPASGDGTTSRPPSPAATAPATPRLSGSAGGSAVFAAPLPESEFVILLWKASSARDKGDYATARQLYLEAQKKDAKDYRVSQGLGNLYADQKEWTAAEQAYRDALKAQPTGDDSLRLSLAFVILQSMIAGGDRSRAGEVEQVLNSVAETNPYNESVYDLYDQFFAFQDADPRKMALVYKRGLSHDPTSATLNLRYAETLYRLGRPNTALRFVRKAEENAAHDEVVLVAKAYENKRQYRNAERVLRTALEWRPGDATVLYNLGSVMVRRKHFTSALKVLQQASTAAPDAFAPVLVTGIAQLGKGDLAAADATFDKAATRLSEDTDAVQRLAYWRSVLGDKYRSKGRLDDAVRAYDKSLKGVDNPDVRDTLMELKQRPGTSKGLQ